MEMDYHSKTRSPRCRGKINSGGVSRPQGSGARLCMGALLLTQFTKRTLGPGGLGAGSSVLVEPTGCAARVERARSDRTFLSSAPEQARPWLEQACVRAKRWCTTRSPVFGPLLKGLLLLKASGERLRKPSLELSYRADPSRAQGPNPVPPTLQGQSRDGFATRRLERLRTQKRFR